MDTKQLKQRILDLAIRGKLVPQDPNDEPASVLLERIRAEKEQLIAQGKLKKSKTKASDKPHYENVPFEIPESWEWVTLGEIGKWQAGGTPNRGHKEYYGGNIPWLKTGDLNDGYITHIPEYITQLGYENSSAKLNPKDSVLIALYGATIGKVGILTFPATTNQACCACIEYTAVDRLYLFYFLRQNRDNFISMGSGGAQPNISKEIITATPIPLPPINEQKRIVTAIEKWFALINELEANKEDLKECIKQVKSKVLDLAIHGKLVLQDPNDEHAIELLKRINPNFKPCDTSHYENMPSGWTVSSINDIGVKILNGYAFKSSIYRESGIKVIRITNVQDGFVCDDDPKYYPTDYANELQKYMLHENDLLMSLTGNVGRVGFLPKEMLPAALNQRVGCLRGGDKILSKDYLYYYLQSNSFKQDCLDSAKGVAQLNISTEWLKEHQIPLPPYGEQLRIVKKISVIFNLIDSISAEL